MYAQARAAFELGSLLRVFSCHVQARAAELAIAPPPPRLSALLGRLWRRSELAEPKESNAEPCGVVRERERGR